MREILPALYGWYADGAPFGLATVVSVSRGGPRGPGAAMAVGPGDEVLGSVSGGCVEAAVYELAREAVADGRARTATFGQDRDDPFAAGPTCGGEITVLVRPVTAAADPAFAEVAGAVARGLPVTWASAVGGAAPPGASLAAGADRLSGSLGEPGLDAAVAADARRLLRREHTALRHYGPRGEHPADAAHPPRAEHAGRHPDPGDGVTVFLQPFPAPPRMLVFGAVDHAAAVAGIGLFLGYRVTVCDARPVFATPRRFPAGVEVVVEWPHRHLAAVGTDDRTVICVLTHDTKFDVPLLAEALRRPAAYIGVMGSRRTHTEREARLRERGIGPAELSRLRSPVGLDLGARTPQEVAVAVAAEIVADHRGGSGRPLTGAGGAIHGGG